MNRFGAFNVGAGQTANVVPSAGADRLLRVVADGFSRIDGTLNAQVATAGGAVAGGVINAGTLTLTTPTEGFRDELLAEVNGGGVNPLDRPSARLFEGSEALDPAGGSRSTASSTRAGSTCGPERGCCSTGALRDATRAPPRWGASPLR